LENVLRFSETDGIHVNDELTNFIAEQEADLLHTLLKDKVSITANEDFRTVLGEESEKWIDPYTGKLILAYEYTYDPNTGNGKYSSIRRL